MFIYNEYLFLLLYESRLKNQIRINQSRPPLKPAGFSMLKSLRLFISPFYVSSLNIS